MTAKLIEPFEVTLKEFGVFGGKTRGVLWLKPEYTRSGGVDRIADLHVRLDSALPLGQQRKGGITPHFTVSHFASAEEAMEAGERFKGFDPVVFTVDRVYLMSRNGDGGQFRIGAEVMLGSGKVVVHEAGRDFELMPTEEFEWVAQQRKGLQDRKKRVRRRRGNKR